MSEEKMTSQDRDHFMVAMAGLEGALETLSEVLRGASGQEFRGSHLYDLSERMADLRRMGTQAFDEALESQETLSVSIKALADMGLKVVALKEEIATLRREE